MHFSVSRCTRILLPFCNLGRMKYDQALRIQEDLVQRQLKSPSQENADILLLVEHDPVYTVGMRSNEFTEVDKAVLQAKGADFHRTNRGGLITFHGPGQLVAYPILNLQNYKPSVRWYVDRLEEVLIKTAADFGVACGRTKNTGIWVQEKSKIAAIGLHVRRMITSHGIALNCNTDLTWFNCIVPCGLEGLSVTSVSVEREIPTTVADVTPIFLKKFGDVFNVELKETTLDDFTGDAVEDSQKKQNVI